MKTVYLYSISLSLSLCVNVLKMHSSTKFPGVGVDVDAKFVNVTIPSLFIPSQNASQTICFCASSTRI